jgi:hypothetical protein
MDPEHSYRGIFSYVDVAYGCLPMEVSPHMDAEHEHPCKCIFPRMSGIPERCILRNCTSIDGTA